MPDPTRPAAGGCWFFLVKSRRAEPLLDPRFFASVPFSAATLTAVAAFAAFAGFLLVVAAYVVLGVGFGMINAPITNTAWPCWARWSRLSSAPR